MCTLTYWYIPGLILLGIISIIILLVFFQTHPSFMTLLLLLLKCIMFSLIQALMWLYGTYTGAMVTFVSHCYCVAGKLLRVWDVAMSCWRVRHHSQWRLSLCMFSGRTVVYMSLVQGKNTEIVVRGIHYIAVHNNST